MLRNYTLILFCLSINAWSQNPEAQGFPVEISVQSGHFASVRVVQYSPDGRFILSGGLDRNIRLWEASTGREIRSFQLESWVRSLCFSPDASIFLSVDGDGLVQLWKTASGKEIRRITNERGYKSVRFLPNGSHFILGGGPTTAELWSIDSDRPHGSFQGESLGCVANCHRALDVSPDGSSLLTATSKGEVVLWSIETQTELDRYKYFPDNRHNSSSPLLIDFGPKGKTFVAASEDEGILIWPIPKSQPIVLLKPEIISSGLKSMFNDIRYHPGGEKVIALFYHGVSGSFQRKDSTSVHIFNLGKPEIASEENLGPLQELRCVDISPLGQEMILGRNNIPQIYNLENKVQSLELTGYLSPLKDMVDYWIMRATKDHVLSPDGNTITKKVGTKVLAWDLKSGKVVGEFGGHDKLVLAMAFSPDGKLFVTAGQDQVINCWNFSTGQLRWSRETPHRVFALAFDPAGQNLISGHFEGLIMSWQADSGRFDRRIRNPSGQWIDTPLDLNFTPNGYYLTWNSQLTEIRTATPVKEFIGHTDRVQATGFSPDGKLMLTGGWDGELMVWDIFSTLRIQQFSGHSGMIHSATFSPDGKTVASGGEDKVLRLWDLNSGEQLASLTGHKASITSVTFTPDQKYLISSSQDGLTKVWDLTTRKELFSHIALDKKSWMAKTDQGSFFATEEAMESIHFVQGLNTYALDQFFEDFYNPAIIQSVMTKGPPLKETRDIASRLAESPPPKIEIVSPKSGDAQENEQEILIKVTNTGGGTDEIKVMQNGKRIIDDQQGLESLKQGKSLYRTYQIQLVPGINRIEFTGFSQGRIESFPVKLELARPITDPIANCYIMAIGINQYKNSKLNLNYALADAQSFTELLTKRGKRLFKKIESVTLYDEKATKSNILAKLRELGAKASPQDVFYFYYAGHGSMLEDRFYFIPTDNVRLYEKEHLEKEAIYAGEVQEILKEIKALKQVLVIDACHSGGSTELLATRGGSEEKALAQLSRSAGVHVMASAGSEQYAGEFASLGHGIFTYLLLEGLSGKADGAPKDGKVTVYEIKSYLDDQVPELTKEIKGHSQYPNTFSRGSDFPISTD